MIPGARLPVIDHSGCRNPGRKVHQQMIRQGTDKWLIDQPYLIETLFCILFMLEDKSYLGEGFAHAGEIFRGETIKPGIHGRCPEDLRQVNRRVTCYREGETHSGGGNTFKTHN